MKGRKPTPTKTLKLRGSWRAKQRTAEPEVREGLPTCPTFLDGEGKRLWKRLCKTMTAMQLASPDYREAMAGFCQNWSLFVKLSKKLNAFRGPQIEYRRLATMATDAYNAYMKACSLFGLTPADKARVKVTKDIKPGGKERFAQGS